MSEFRTPPEEVMRLIVELQEVKEAVRTLANRLVSMDKHLRRAYQLPKPARATRPARRDAANGPSRDTILQKFDELRSTFLNMSAAAAEARLSGITDDELRDLARELGLPNARKAGLERVRTQILQRLRESALLGVGSVLKRSEETAQSEAKSEQTSDVSGRDASPTSQDSVE